MSTGQKILGVFGVLELIGAAISVFSAVNGAAGAWGNAAFAVFTGVFLLAAAKDAAKIQPAWLLTLLSLVLSVLGTALAITGKNGMLNAEIVALVINAVVFLAANSVKKQIRR